MEIGRNDTLTCLCTVLKVRVLLTSEKQSKAIRYHIERTALISAHISFVYV